jgi:hypothetical protein
VRRLAGSECVLLGHVRLIVERGTVGACPDTRIPVMVVSMKKKGAVHCYVHPTCSVLLHYDCSKCCVCPLHKFVYTFEVVKLFLKHPIYFWKIRTND